MRRPVVTVALVLAAAGVLAADTRELTPEAATPLFEKSPSFGGKTGRTFSRVNRVIVVSDTQPRTGWVAEVDFVEGGKTVTGRAVVVATSILRPSDKVFFSAEGWALPDPLLTGPRADEMLQSLQEARRRANEMVAIADSRTMMVAQVTYASSSNGTYATLACLAAPKSCNPAYSYNTTFDGADTHHGYRRKLYLGPRAATFAYTSVPLEPGITGVRGFCVDLKGICFSADGREPEASGGSCPASCSTLETFK
jgi:hypothetical protein